MKFILLVLVFLSAALLPAQKVRVLTVQECVDIALEKDISIALRINVDKGNIEDLPRLADFIVEKGWADTKKITPYIAPVEDFSCINYEDCLPHNVLIKRVFELMDTHENMKKIYMFGWHGIDTLTSFVVKGKLLPPQFKNCEAETNGFYFDLYGDIYVCGESVGKKEFSIGKFIPELKFDEDKLHKWRNRSILSIPECVDCDVSILCGGGCGIGALQEKGILNSPQCKPVKEALELGFNYYYSDILKRGNKLSNKSNI